ncbi:MAG: response regulator, partial [Microcoleus sp. SU_5_6]|nr:response regulator [Microcoleus sp. SU_5_6]
MLETELILAVDDTPANLNVISETLTDAGYEVSIATDGERALKQVQYTRPSLILLDVMMPGIDGFETCRRLKAAAAT